MACFRQLAVIALLATAAFADAATLTWNGSAGPLWSNPANWDTATIPANGDSLVHQRVELAPYTLLT